MLSPTARTTARPARLRASLLLAAAASTGALTVGVLVPTASAAPVVTPVAAPAAVSADQPPTQAQVDEARRQAAESAAKLAQAQADLAAAQGRLDALAKEAGAALERYQQAMEAKWAAENEETLQRQRLAEAEAALEQGRKDLGQWASQTYRGGGGTLQEYSGFVTVLKGGATDDTASAIASAKRIGDGRTNAVEAFEQAQRVQADATTRAADAAAEAVRQAEIAVAAKQQADTLVAQQRSQVDALAVLQAAASGAASGDSARAATLASNLAAAKAQAAAAAAAATAGGFTAVGDCETGINLSGFANGLIPRSALCPLASSPNHVLRSDAANAFAALNQAYAAEFGSNIAITDSYRTLAEQIDVKARKPGLAATPGTSRHGLGIAVDLGGGIQNATSTQHLWMDRNAALYGWINPGWAQNRGGQFEPWHWEFTG
ncbi:M15 family metallopeptidase [Kineococcus sp. NPDC059986]|uniref:M15 family metallopeptidase n=1 Tax=Kineococcus sp. NPDC059986 TaxID=3155538 RepID=UPI00344BFB7B